MHFLHPKIRLCECLDLLREVISEAIWGTQSNIFYWGICAKKDQKHSLIDVRLGSKYISAYVWKT